MIPLHSGVEGFACLSSSSIKNERRFSSVSSSLVFVILDSFLGNIVLFETTLNLNLDTANRTARLLEHRCVSEVLKVSPVLVSIIDQSQPSGPN